MSQTVNRLPYWWEVAKNQDEKRVFVGQHGEGGLARCKKYHWRSVEKLAKEAGLTKTRTEAIIEKYAKQKLVLQNEKDPELWGYWEIVAPELADQNSTTLVQEDQAQRLEKAKIAKK